MSTIRGSVLCQALLNGWCRRQNDFAFPLQSGEALGAIADPATLEILEKYSHDERPEVAETCQIASRRVRWAMEHGDKAEAAVRAIVAPRCLQDSMTTTSWGMCGAGTLHNGAGA
jgi:hypothetical protein